MQSIAGGCRIVEFRVVERKRPFLVGHHRAAKLHLGLRRRGVHLDSSVLSVIILGGEGQVGVVGGGNLRLHIQGDVGRRRTCKYDLECIHIGRVARIHGAQVVFDLEFVGGARRGRKLGSEGIEVGLRIVGHDGRRLAHARAGGQGHLRADQADRRLVHGMALQ